MEEDVVEGATVGVEVEVEAIAVEVEAVAVHHHEEEGLLLEKMSLSEHLSNQSILCLRFMSHMYLPANRLTHGPARECSSSYLRNTCHILMDRLLT